MRIVIAPDSFKGSLSSLEAAQAMERGVKRVLPQSETVLIPLSDGGDGLLASLVSGRGGRVCEYEVTGPLGRPVSAQLGLLEEGRT
ncbi:MAG: glycerate kinase, partial [Firmicutes bacterium]|nr:glycerate kinase [Bacillota bacterium]